MRNTHISLDTKHNCVILWDLEISNFHRYVKILVGVISRMRAGILVRYSAGKIDSFSPEFPSICLCMPGDGYQGLPICVQSGRGVKLTIHFHLVLRLKIRGTINLLASYLLKQCTDTDVSYLSLYGTSCCSSGMRNYWSTRCHHPAQSISSLHYWLVSSFRCLRDTEHLFD